MGNKKAPDYGGLRLGSLVVMRELELFARSSAERQGS